MNEGVNKDLAMITESSKSDDLRKAFLQLGAPLSWQSVIPDVVRTYHPEIPKGPRTTVDTPRLRRQKCIVDGVYIHFGLKLDLHRQLRSSVLTTVVIQLNIDGCSLFKRSNTQLWPVLGRCVNVHSQEPFIIDIFCEPTKPSDVSAYLCYTVDDSTGSLTNGLLNTNYSVPVIIKLSCVICGAPARESVKQTIINAGYHGCDECVQVGNGIHNKLVFSPQAASPLCDSGFHRRMDRNHHVGDQST
ncbi:hypothetical protein EG68_11459 [Paragonimus skrjabini miyazakii]|uniref:Uncharacterized protein n=1 Tax=Paragonimus skrjabini miyazakii TaxID=59628 RepID=A0A8S9YHW7_9TREM|nr:hypothetical protein EG68_11459 [Paragonimus skrjabini miyazakii]